MNAVEIEEAISALAAKPFDPAEFPYAFLEAFGRKDTAIKRLRSGEMNKSDLSGVLQRDHIHIAVASPGAVGTTMANLRASPATARWKARFIVATDGEMFEAEELGSLEAPIVCPYRDFPDHFGFFLPLAGISTVQQIRESAFDIKATGRLNRLYVELLKDNPAWDTEARREDMNHFMARLIFCFFAEDTGIFVGNGLFTNTVTRMSAGDATNTHTVIATIFQAMHTTKEARPGGKLPRWTDDFPYVNGGLFSGSTDVPVFSKMARSYLLNVGALEWKKINPDIFGSMIQAVADDEERGALGMHYTSVPNILKVLNPLFLDDLREKLAEAGDNPRKLLNLRNRMARIRVFDPACGSGNFLVIAYKEMRAIEAEINKQRGEADRATQIPKTNFRGIELRSFPAEIARLALIIAEYQADVLYRGPTMALAEFLPLDAENWITCGNALRLDWLSICPPTGTGVKFHGDDLFATPLDQAQIDFENEGGETYICGNPPYLGSTWQDEEQKADLKAIFDERTKSWKSLDYVAGWFMKAADYGTHTSAAAAFVSTNSICQGQQVPILWPVIFATGHKIAFAHTSFKWANLASHNAGVTVAIVGIARQSGTVRRLFDEEKGRATVREPANINAYLVSGANVVVEKRAKPFGDLADMNFGNKPVDGGNLLLTCSQFQDLGLTKRQSDRFIRRIYGSAEFIRGLTRYCLWIDDDDLEEANSIETIRQRIEAVREMRLASRDTGANEMAKRAHQFREMKTAISHTIVMPRTSSEARPYLPAGIIISGENVTSEAFALYDAPLWNMALIASRIHLVWIATVCGKLKTDFRYSNTLGWNTFPVPTLTEKNKADLTRCAEDILLAREGHFPATIADLYNLETMPADLRAAHERNDEVLERIYIGRRFKNDTERLEKLFDMYTKMTAAQGARGPGAKTKPKKARASA
ncbi:MAG: class I SAM-dependent DNA methyltransferase [Burkholderiales bacterium]|nr:class I SAM-dependent DNA methyltransferase [Burkholderiales bacterium]